MHVHDLPSLIKFQISCKSSHIKALVCPSSQIEFWFLFVYLHCQSSRYPFTK